MTGLRLIPPGLTVNRYKGDPAEHRAHQWLEWHGGWDLDVAVLGVPYDGASTVRAGARHAPDAVRRALSYYTAFSSEHDDAMDGLRAADIGDVEVVVTDMAETFARTSEVIAHLVAGGVKPVVIGGDHSIAFATVSGICRARAGERIGIIQFDAHHDLREAHFGAESSGVPFRRLLDLRGDQVRGENLVQIGIAEFANAPAHAAYAREQGVTVIPALSVRREGIDRAVDRALERAGDGTDAVYVSLDVDCIDQSQAPGTAAPNPFGLDSRDVQWALGRLAEHPKTIGLEIVEISPPLDLADMTANLGAAMVLHFCFGVARRSF